MFLIIRSGSPEPPGVREAGMVGWDVSCLSPIFRENNHMKPNQSKSVFCNSAKWTARASGQPTAFVFALLVIVVWAFTGPIFGFSDTWQLVINTGTTIITFLMVFLIQNTQNRDSEAMHIKIDELIRAIEGAHNALLTLEDLDQAELDRIRANYAKLAQQARKDLQQGKLDTGVCDVER
jgi:low affinity Fe/Cu permease